MATKPFEKDTNVFVTGNEVVAVAGEDLVEGVAQGFIIPVVDLLPGEVGGLALGDDHDHIVDIRAALCMAQAAIVLLQESFQLQCLQKQYVL